MESQNEALLVVWRECSNTGSDILSIKRFMLIVWDIEWMKKFFQLYTTLVIPWAGIYVLRHLNHQKCIALVTKPVYGESVAFLLATLLHDI